MGKALVTLDEFKIYKTLNSTEQDENISALITRCSEIVKTYCGKTFVDYYSTNKVEYFDAVGTDSVFVNEYPIVSVVSITRSLDGGATSTAITEYTDFFVNKEIGEITSSSVFVTSGESTIPRGVSSQSLCVTYKGGYAKLPDDLRQAVLDLVEYYRANEYTPRQDFQAFKIENLGFRTGDSSNLPSHIQRVLNMYREL